MNGAHPCLESIEALVGAATRGLNVFEVRTEFVRLRNVVGLDFCKESGDSGDEGVYAGVFLGGSSCCKPLNPVGLWVCLASESREIGGVAAQTVVCGGVGCGKEAASSCPRKTGGGSGAEQRGCRRSRVNHNSWPRATRHGHGVRGGLSQRLEGVGRGVKGSISLTFGGHFFFFIFFILFILHGSLRLKA